MPFEFKLPDVGEGVAEGELVSWLVDVGDTVTEDQPVAEVETDKALVEIPSPVDGTVKELRADAGEMIPVGDVFIVFDVEGEEPEGEVDPVEPEPAEETEPDATEAVETEPDRAAGRVFAPPHVRRLARELDVELETVSGSGPSGRITEADVRAAADGAEPTETEAEAEPEPTPEPATTEPEPAEPGATQAPQVEAADRDRTLAAPATRRVADELDVDINAVPAVEERDGEAFVTAEAVREYADRQVEAREAEVAARPETAGEREERVPYKGVRRTIGEQMERSKYTAPHVSHHDQVVVDELVAARKRLKPKAEDRGINLTYMPFVMKAVTAALKEFPFMNATLDEEVEEIILKNYYNIGMAVATDAGLMVPVVDDVDRKGLLQVASEVNELAAKARDRSIGLDELQGSTFSVTNFGVIGGEYATPIINYPEVAILGIGELAQRPVVEDGEVVARYTLPLSLTIDHRVIDGAVAAEFTNTLMDYLRDPTLLLIE